MRVTRMWKSDESINVMDIDDAVANIVSNRKDWNPISPNRVRKLLEAGETLKTRKALFCLEGLAPSGIAAH